MDQGQEEQPEQEETCSQADVSQGMPEEGFPISRRRRWAVLGEAREVQSSQSAAGSAEMEEQTALIAEYEASPRSRTSRTFATMPSSERTERPMQEEAEEANVPNAPLDKSGWYRSPKGVECVTRIVMNGKAKCKHEASFYILNPATKPVLCAQCKNVMVTMTKETSTNTLQAFVDGIANKRAREGFES